MPLETRKGPRPAPSGPVLVRTRGAGVCAQRREVVHVRPTPLLPRCESGESLLAPAGPRYTAPGVHVEGTTCKGLQEASGGRVPFSLRLSPVPV